MDALLTDHSVSAGILSRAEWTASKKEHEEKLSVILDPYLEKRSKQIKDPVTDFLFEYYHFRPAHLQRWSPGAGILLELGDESDLPEISELTTNDSAAWLDLNLFPDNRQESFRWMYKLLVNTQNANPFFGCFGMHEWAMVYKADEIRHDQLPLRLSSSEIAEFVESRPLLCTHFDAFRFFTDEARPLNKQQLSREQFQETEQPGCIHTNMDLYKWSFKLYPWISSDQISDAFMLALEARRFDMQASPYDLREYGLDPICIETESGRKEYLRKQKEIYKKSLPVRNRLIKAYQKLEELLSASR